jgi:hypothetical protein
MASHFASIINIGLALRGKDADIENCSRFQLSKDIIIFGAGFNAAY